MPVKIRYTVSLALLLLISACDNNNNIKYSNDKPDEINNYVKKIKSELVYVKGGEFLMGDYGEEYGPENLPYDSNKDSKPLHKVQLSNYSISRFKTNNNLFGFYLSYTGVRRNKIEMGPTTKKRWDTLNNNPDTPAHVDWSEANKYCTWLADVTKLPFSLPTEAQWEFAARNRGEYVIAPTDNGTIDIVDQKGINVTTADDREQFAEENHTQLGTLSPMPGNFRAPNPLGIYDMAGNGYEWMKDWYDPDYYNKSPIKDPQGPEKPVFKDYQGNFTKVTRSQDFSGPGRGLTVVRHFKDPDNNGRIPADKTVRCAVNSSVPVN